MCVLIEPEDEEELQFIRSVEEIMWSEIQAIGLQSTPQTNVRIDAALRAGGTRVPVTPHPTGHDIPKVAAVVSVLHDWFRAMEEGTHTSRFPDPNYIRRNNRPPWTDEEVDKVIEALDHEIRYEMDQRPNYWAERGYDIPTDFSRLDKLQRRALVEQVDNALRESGIRPKQG